VGHAVDLPRLSGESAAAGRGQRPLKLDFLSPGTHPELLGQLGRYQIECDWGRRDGDRA
jgi:hypothetical protein